MPTMHEKNYVATLLMLTLLLPALAAKAENEDVIARCAKIPSVGDRILCLEDALRVTSDAEASAEAGVEDTQPAAAVAPAEGASEATPMEASSVAPSAAAMPPTAGAAASAVKETEIGEDQLRARNMTEEEKKAELESAVNLRVVRYSTVPYQRLVVELENGQIWRQITGDVQEIRVDLKRNQTVDITESRLGGYQLRLNEIRRTIRVERIR